MQGSLEEPQADQNACKEASCTEGDQEPPLLVTLMGETIC